MRHFLSKFLMGVIFLAHIGAQGQLGSPGGLPTGFNHAMLDVLGAGPAFYGQTIIQLSPTPGSTPTTMNCDMAMLGGNLRLEMSSFEGGTNLSSFEATQLNRMHSFSIIRPDLNRMFMVFPDFKSYVETVYAKTQKKEKVAAPLIGKTPIGQDPVGDQPCQKNQWHVAESDGQQYDLTVWNSPDWSNFPIQIKMASPAILVQFQTLHLAAPSQELFEIPAGYFKYEGITEAIQKNAEKAPMTNAP